jgi:hypothetical protein
MYVAGTLRIFLGLFVKVKHFSLDHCFLLRAVQEKEGGMDRQRRI